MPWYLHNKPRGGDVVAAPGCLHGLGADQHRGQADADVQIVLVPTSQRSLVVEGNPPAAMLTGGETVIHDQETLLRSHVRVCAHVSVGGEARLHGGGAGVDPGRAARGEHSLVVEVSPKVTTFYGILYLEKAHTSGQVSQFQTPIHMFKF